MKTQIGGLVHNYYKDIYYLQLLDGYKIIAKDCKLETLLSIICLLVD